MKSIYTDRVLNRLEQYITEIHDAHRLNYYDRLRAFKHYCATTSVIASCLAQLSETPYDFRVDPGDLDDRWPAGEAGYAYRWNAINQAVDGHSNNKDLIFSQLGTRQSLAYSQFTKMFVVPLYHYLVDQLEASSMMLYILLRYKRWAEWFEAEKLRWIYSNDGEGGLDRDLRRFLFESGIDYPYSQPQSPGGRADIVAGLETDDPLVLEVKIWDSNKGYKKDRCCDGLRQVMDYADRYGKDRGYVVVFNLDPEPVEFVGPIDTDEWPPRLEHGGKTYYFIAVDIAEQMEPVSQRDKGKPVKTYTVPLVELLVS